ncbi:probable GMP synthase [glutamine-hydrolyzing] [Zingiber officinale]|uniref:probable GMP synthase [glutamine-hydrolyzing] n=1 Tax=Zingiber officinale TaxID=94328 RepID=UPI001C4BBE82|nr:probable GMP synthase [glutamine-hydrolyzing] [Zingiber officinale]
MSGAPKLLSSDAADSEARPVLMPGGNQAKSPAAAAQKPVSKPLNKTECLEVAGSEKKKKKAASSAADLPLIRSSLIALSAFRRHDLLSQPNLPMSASCSSDASTDSFCSQSSIGRIGRTSLTRQSSQKTIKIVAKAEKDVPPAELFQGKRKCAWVTPSTESCYATFHDEEWGVPIHDDKKLFELLVLSGALAELTWPVILNKRHMFRDVFSKFDPVAVSKLNEKKIVASGSIGSSLLSEPKLRAIVENARKMLKIIDEFGSFDRYCWSFVNYKPIVCEFRYPRQVPVRTAKADVMSKDLVRRGFRSVGPTVIYSFMQAAGLTNDHLISCFRFKECVAAASLSAGGSLEVKVTNNLKANENLIMQEGVELELSRGAEKVSLS